MSGALEKNQRLTLSCARLGSELEGVCSYEGMAVFVPGVLPGEMAEVQIVKALPNYAFGRLVQVLEPSAQRAQPRCPVYDKCGGCSGQHMTYEATLEAKRLQVLDCLNRIAGLGLATEQVPPVLGAAEPWHCRNKTALPVGGSWREPELGFYRRRSHQIISIENCPISMTELSPIVGAVKTWMSRCRVQPYDEVTGKGLLRHVVIRSNRRGDVMVLLVAASDRLPEVSMLTELLQKAMLGFRALHLSVNRARNNVILGSSSRKLWGADTIEETLLGLTFEIAPLSFFQVNPDQCERLYECAIRLAALRPEDIVVDAYAGAGTISLCMAGSAQKVIGIEIVPQAVEAARRNAARNGIANAEFHLGAVEDVLPGLVGQGLHPGQRRHHPPEAPAGDRRGAADAAPAGGVRQLPCAYAGPGREAAPGGRLPAGSLSAGGYVLLRGRRGKRDLHDFGRDSRLTEKRPDRMPTELFSPLMTAREARLKTPLALAYVGDTVWDLLVRRSLLRSGEKAGALHRRAVQLVNAAAQARASREIEPYLTEEERDVLRRGENAHAKHAVPKNQSPEDYSRATGLEALMGYLYLSGQMERIGELFDIAGAIH